MSSRNAAMTATFSNSTAIVEDRLLVVDFILSAWAREVVYNVCPSRVITWDPQNAHVYFSIHTHSKYNRNNHLYLVLVS